MKTLLKITGFDSTTGIITIHRLPNVDRTHEFWAISFSLRNGTWSIQRAGRKGPRTTYDKPLPGHSGFPTKKAAQAYKEENLS